MPTAQMTDTDFFQHRTDRLTVRAWPGAPLTTTPLASHQHDIFHADGEALHEVGKLRHITDMARGSLGRAPQHADTASRRLVKTEYQLEQRALAATVGPDQSHYLARADLKVDIVENDLLAIPEGHAANINGIRCICRHRAKDRSDTAPGG